MSAFRNSGGTSETEFKIGLDGPTLERISAASLAIKDTDGTAFAAIQALLVQIMGDDIEFNAAAAGAGDDWKMTVSRPATGMTMDVKLVLPADGAPTTGMAITVTSVAGGVIELGYTTVASGADALKTDTTNLAFGSAGTVAMFNNPTGGEVRRTRVVIDTSFDGTPSMSVGIAGQVSKYMPATALDLTAAPGTIYEYESAELPAGGVEAIIATYAAGGATVGAARIEVDYANPS